MILINFKIYPQTFGDRAVKLAKICKEVNDETGIKVIPVVSVLDLRTIKEKVGGEVWIQHVDNFFEGKHTGYISPIAAIAAGADGCLLNLSENELPPGKIRQILINLQKLNSKLETRNPKQIQNTNDQNSKPGSFDNLKFDNWKFIENCKLKIENFRVCVCFKSRNQINGRLKKLNPQPNFVAYEPTELIGGESSVSQAQPEMINNVVRLLPKHQVVVGAGIHSAEDVKIALKLGAKGVLVSSDVVTADDPKRELIELARVFNLERIK